MTHETITLPVHVWGTIRRLLRGDAPALAPWQWQELLNLVDAAKVEPVSPSDTASPASPPP